MVPETRYAKSGNLHVAYQVVGDGPLDLVFVHGWISHIEHLWEEPSIARFLGGLASFSRLILLDKRGTGMSDPVPLDELPTLELAVRVGVHTGECEVIGAKIGGLAVHIGARVTAAAGVGDVLVSSTVKDLVAGSGLRFEDRGAHVLKGVPGQWRLFAVASELTSS